MSQGSTDRSGKLCGGVAALALVLAMAWMTGCAPPRPASPATTTTPENQVSELQVQDPVVGQGAEATAGSTVTVHYSGWLYDQGATDHKGKPFDSSRESGRPFSFTLGARQAREAIDRHAVLEHEQTPERRLAHFLGWAEAMKLVGNDLGQLVVGNGPPLEPGFQ